MRGFRERGTNVWQRKAVLLGNSGTVLKKKKNLFVMAGNYSSVLSVKGSVNDLAEGCNP